MPLNAFYEDELSYLRELGAEFAHANPKLAGFLSREANDPDVERLLEGFAFLVAKLRQRLDDELPELVQGLIRLLWPHYLRPIPPMTVLAFQPSSAGGQTVVRVPRGAQVRSRPVDGVTALFRTAFAVDVLPYTIARIEMDNRATSARLAFQLQPIARGTLAALAGGKLRIFFNTEREPLIGRSLLLWLLRHVRRILVSSEDGRRFELGQEHIRPVGFADDDALLPAPANVFIGFRLLQEYLLYPAKFLFVDLVGLDELAAGGGRGANITIEFDRAFPEQLRVAEGHLRLNCTPALNLFAQDGLPIRLTGTKTEYRVRPSGGAGYAIHSVEGVTGYLQGRPGREDYVAFESFRHDLPGDGTKRLFYRERVRPSVVGRGIDHYLAFVDRLDRKEAPPVEIVASRLQCTNGPIAERIPIGAIDQATADVPNTVAFSNILSVTPETPPPLGDALFWRLIANLARNYGSLADVAALRNVIASYDFRAVGDAQARRRLELLLESLDSFETSGADAIVRGIPARMRVITLKIAESKIGGEGEMFLFGSVLDAFFAAYASINNLHRFAIRGLETNVVHQWLPRTGTAAPI